MEGFCFWYTKYNAAYKSRDISEEYVASDFYLLLAGFMLGLFFNPEDGGDMFFPNVG
jgi:hypothetical protein